MNIKIFDSLADAERQIPLRKMKPVVVEDKNIAIARNANGFFAFQDQCPHLNVKLSPGFVNAWDEVICPWHNYRFSMKNGQEQSGRRCKTLVLYRIEINENGFFIDII